MDHFSTNLVLPFRTSGSLVTGAIAGPKSSLTSLALFGDEIPLSPLLSLPGEIRNMIYRLLLTSPRLQVLRRILARNHCSPYVLEAIPVTVAILSTCKQIHTEATPILYTENVFTAHPSLLIQMPCLVNPSKPICTPEIGRRIRRWYVAVRLDTDARFKEEEVTLAFSGAEELEVEATEAMFRSAGNGILMLFKGVRGVGTARVHGSVADDFARWLESSMMTPIDSEPERFDYTIPDPWRLGNR